MRTLFLNPPSFEGFDGGASSRWPATREIESYWYPVWLCYPAGMLPDSKVLDAPPHKISIEQTVTVAKDYELGMSAVRSAVEANPNNLSVVITAGVASLHCGTVSDALHYLQRAIKLNPRDVTAYWALTATAHAHMILGDYREALAFAERSMALWPDFACNLWMLIAANAHLGRLDEARRFLGDLVRVNPGITVSRVWAGQPQMDPSRCAAILDGLRLAGLPEK